jgi:hypothetical protein
LDLVTCRFFLLGKDPLFTGREEICWSASWLCCFEQGMIGELKLAMSMCM